MSTDLNKVADHTSTLIVKGKDRPPRLSEEMSYLITRFAERSVSLREVISVLHGRAYTLLLIFLALPFCTPIPLPGLSTPFGLVIALVGFRLSLRQKPWLPSKLLDTSLPPRFFVTLFTAGRKIILTLEWGLRPRWGWLVDNGLLQHLYGTLILVSGILLLLPLPVPFSNMLPALAIVLTAAAILERDGYCALAAIFAFTVTLVFFTVLGWGGAECIEWIKKMLFSSE